MDGWCGTVRRKVREYDRHTVRMVRYRSESCQNCVRIVSESCDQSANIKITPTERWKGENMSDLVWNTSTEDLILKGNRTSRRGLLGQANVHIQLVHNHREVLQRFGLTDAQISALEALNKAVSESTSSRASLQSTSRTASKNTEAAVDAAKTVIRQVSQASKIVANTKGFGSVAANAFVGASGLGRSVDKIRDYLLRIHPAAVALREDLRPYLAGADAGELITEAITRLNNTDRVQETGIDSLPVASQQLYLQMGQLLSLIELINTIGRIAFDGNAVVRGQFNKDILLRARKQSSDAPAVPVTPVTPVTPTA